MSTSIRRARRLTLTIIAALLALLIVDLAANPAQAAVTNSDFLKKSLVKSKMDGTGTWYRYLGGAPEPPLGADPAECAEHLPLAKAKQTRTGHYWGPLAAPGTYYGSVEVSISEFAKKRAARRAVKKISQWVAACPTTVQWYCEDCDGIEQIDRSAAKPRKVGVQSFTWNESTISMGLGTARAIAARRGRTVVVVITGHQEDPITTTAPPAPSWRTAVGLTRRSLKKATS